MKTIKFVVVLSVSALVTQAQTNVPTTFSKLSEKPKLPIVSVEKRIEASIRKLDEPVFKERVRKFGLSVLKQASEPIDGFQKVLNGIDCSNPDNGLGEMINIQSAVFGHGNAETFYDRVDVFESDLSPRVSVCYPTLIFESSNLGGNDGVFFLFNFKF